MVVLAGCLSDDGNSEEGPSGTGAATEPSETATGRVEDIEAGNEPGIQRIVTEDFGNWVETHESMLDIPSWAKDKKERSRGQEPINYRDFVHTFMNSNAASSGTFVEHLVAFSDPIDDSSSQEPYRRVYVQHRVKETKNMFSGESDFTVVSTAVERFLRENVHGVIDHGEKTDQELLALAKQ